MRGSYWSFMSLLILHLCSVTQCFSLTLVFSTDLSNRISFLLSLLHSSLFGILLVHFEFFLFSLLLLSTFVFSMLYYNFSTYSVMFHHSFLHLSLAFMIYHLLCVAHVTSSFCTITPLYRHFLYICDITAKLGLPWPAWQGTDLMHNHVLADVDRSCMDSPGRHSSVSRPELSSDLSEDSDYDSIWTTHSYRMGSVPRKSCISHQN